MHNLCYRQRNSYEKFPAGDAAKYEELVPFQIQTKIYEAYKSDFENFGYDPPVKRESQLEVCPEIPHIDIIPHASLIPEISHI